MAQARVHVEKLIQQARQREDGTLVIDSVIHLSVERDGHRAFSNAVRSQHILGNDGQATVPQIGRPLDYRGPWDDAACGAALRQYLASLEQPRAQWLSAQGGGLMSSRLHLRKASFEFEVDD